MSSMFESSVNAKPDAPTNVESPDSLTNTIVNPFENGLIEAWNTTASMVGRADKAIELRPVQESSFMSAGWFGQRISSGVGFALPFAVAATGAGMFLRSASKCFQFESTAAKLEQSGTAAIRNAARGDFAAGSVGKGISLDASGFPLTAEYRASQIPNIAKYMGSAADFSAVDGVTTHVPPPKIDMTGIADAARKFATSSEAFVRQGNESGALKFKGNLGAKSFRPNLESEIQIL